MAKQYRISDLMETTGVRFGTSGARGLVTAMTAEVCHAYAAAFLQTVPARAGRVALAIDLRPSSPGIASACVAAIEAAGLKTNYCGALPTPALALHAEAEGIPAIMVTGSHIPFDRNGIKFYSANGEITKDDEARIRDAVVSVPDSGVTASLPMPNGAARQAYLQRYLDFFPTGFLAGKRIAVYEHSSVARDLLRELLEGFGATVLSLGRTDAFVPIDTEAVSAEDVAQARRWAATNAFDAIVSTDGDADRPLVGDEHGDWFRGDVTGILCAQYLRAGAVATTVNCNTAIDTCGAFSRVARTRIGSPYVIEGIEQLLAAGAGPVVGFEPNGGFLVGSPLTRSGRPLPALKTRDAVLPMLSLLALAGECGQPLSALSGRLPARFTASDRLQAFPTARSRALIATLASSSAAIEDFLAGLAGKSVSIDETDGLRIRLEADEIVHLRPSGNAPELRCYAEAGDDARARHLVTECLKRAFACGGSTVG